MLAYFDGKMAASSGYAQIVVKRFVTASGKKQ